MTYTLYDYVAPDGRNEFKEWTQDLGSEQRGKLYNQLDRLALHGENLYSDPLSPCRGGEFTEILKLKVRGKVQLRPLLCRGPINIGKEYTLLYGAIEKQDKWQPHDARERAVERRNAVVADDKNRRTIHERVKK